MPQFNEADLTAAVVKSFENTPEPAGQILLQELVKSLHDYVRKTGPHFRRVGICDRFPDPHRPEMHADPQEFILLSDVMGVSMLVDAVNHREREGATETTVLGPFYVGEHKQMPHGTDISPHNMTGEKMFVQSRVHRSEGPAAHWRSRRCLACRR